MKLKIILSVLLLFSLLKVDANPLSGCDRFISFTVVLIKGNSMRKPVYHVFVTQESQPNAQGEKNTYWTKVGVAFAHNGKPGLNIVKNQKFNAMHTIKNAPVHIR